MLKTIAIIFSFVVSIIPRLYGNKCGEIYCSNIVDHVCGAAKKNGAVILKTYHNICHLNRIRCRLTSEMDLFQVPDHLCGIKKKIHYSGRRLADFSVVGAHQACNHTCPTYCVDTYEPACAKIWTSAETSKNRPMINHCHIDMLSCAAGVNVTIEPLAKCYQNPSGLLFMMQIAALKSMKLLDERPPADEAPVATAPRRRALQDWSAKKRLDKILRSNPIFEHYLLDSE